MASIRRTGQVAPVRSTPVTTTAPSGLDSILGFASSLATFGNAVKGLSERRNRKAAAEETARFNRILLTYDDQAQQARLKSGNDITAFNTAMQAPDGEMERHIDNIKDEAVKATAIDAWRRVKNVQEQPIVAAQSEEMAERRQRSAWEAFVAVAPDAAEIGGQMFDPDPGIRQQAAQGVVTMDGLVTNPNGPVLQTGGPAAGAQIQQRWMRDMERAAMYGYLNSQAEKNLPAAYQQMVLSGAPMPGQPGRFFGATWTSDERKAVFTSWSKSQSLAEDLRESQRKQVQEADEHHDDGVYTQFLRDRSQGKMIEPDDYVLKLRDRRGDTAQAIYKAAAEPPKRSASQRIHSAVSEAELDGIISGNGPGIPGALGALVSARDALAANDGLHVLDKAQQLGTLEEAISAVRNHSGESLRTQQEQTALSRFNKIMSNLPAETLVAGTGAEVALEGSDLAALGPETGRRNAVRDSFMGLMANPNVDPRVAADIHIEALRWPNAGGVRDGLLRAFHSPEALQVLRDDPLKALSAFPTVRTDLIAYADGRIDMTRTTLALRTETDWLHEDEARNTEIAISFLSKAAGAELYRDPTQELRAQEAQAQQEAMEILEAQQQQGGTANFGPGA